MQIFFESHATTTDNEANLSSGWNDIDLSDFGYENIADLRRRYIDNLPDVVFCSDLVRSYKTGAITFEGTGVNLIVDRRLRECDYGEYTQLPKETVDGEKASRISTPYPGGESYEDTLSRMSAFIKELSSIDVEKVMIIGHRATQYGLEVLLNNRELEEVVLAPWSWQPGWQYTL